MRRIRIYRNPDCAKCARYARMHLLLDWFRRVQVSTATPASGPLAMGEVVVERRSDGVLLHGAAAFEEICRHIPAYAPFRLLLRVPALRAAVDREMNGCGGACLTEPRRE